MLNNIWISIISASLIFSFFNNTYSEVISGALSSGSECVNLMLVLLATMSFFSGLMKIAEKSGLTQKIAKLNTPLLKMLFHEIPEGH